MSRRQLLLAIAVVLVELIGGMQVYLNQLIMPIMAADMGGGNYYGLIMGVGSVCSVVGLPVGAALLRRYHLPRLLLVLTLLLCAGAVTSAAAPNIWVYLCGQAVRSFVGACLGMTSAGAIALGLSGKARRLTLAFASASWIVSSVVGPTYAAWVTDLFSWRWAMLMYLPFLVAARFVIALNLKLEPKGEKSPIPFGSVLLITVGVSLTIVPLSGVPGRLTMLVGVLVLARVVTLLLPVGTFTTDDVRRRALAVMFFLTGSYFAANELVSLTYHDLFGATADRLGLALLAGGLAWAVVGVICGARPAKDYARYRWRAGTGILLIAVCLAFVAALTLSGASPPVAGGLILVLWTLAGCGMGLAYLDTLSLLFEEPRRDDGLTLEEMAGASVIVESLASTMFVPLVSSLVASAFTAGDPAPSPVPYGLSWALAAVAAAVALAYLLFSGRGLAGTAAPLPPANAD
ncbi:MAG: MFS transporter [Actinomycetaceae bacterium]|nr:MFS transporter [Actinomycetaceae bacterium]